MTGPSSAATPTARPIAEDDVAEYLRRHPDFLSERPDLMRVLTPPARRNGDGVVDLQQFMIERLRAEVARLKKNQRVLIGANRAHRIRQSRINEAVIDLLMARTFEEVIQTLTTDLSMRLDVDAVALCVETEEPNVPGVTRGGVRILRPGTIDAVMGASNDVVLGASAAGDRRIFRQAAGLVQSDALMRLRISPLAPTGLLALGSRDAAHFQDGESTELLDFLARVVEATLRTWLNLPS
ncbi:MAG: DUF484 family protein [Alphaproteobacteria bacterium]|nr:DUF484 family protein [Alphaproteobacteria bacterium]